MRFNKKPVMVKKSGRINVRIDQNENKMLTELSEELKMSRSSVLRFTLREYYDNLKFMRNITDDLR